MVNGARRVIVQSAVALVAASACVTSLAWAAPQSTSSSFTHVAGFDHIVTDKFEYNLNSGDFTIPGHFSATRAGTDLSADAATGNSKRKLLHAVGRVVLHSIQGASGGAVAQRPSTLTSDKLDADGARKMYTATGNMHFTQEGGREANSDNAVLDDANHHLHMEGNVHVRNGEQTIDAAVLDYDTLSGQLIGSGNVTISTPVETPTPGASGTAKPKRKKLPF